MKQLASILEYVAILGVAGVVALIWVYPPWFIRYPTPRRLLRIDKERIKDGRLRNRRWNKKYFTDVKPFDEEVDDEFNRKVTTALLANVAGKAEEKESESASG